MGLGSGLGLGLGLGSGLGLGLGLAGEQPRARLDASLDERTARGARAHGTARVGRAHHGHGAHAGARSAERGPERLGAHSSHSQFESPSWYNSTAALALGLTSVGQWPDQYRTAALRVEYRSLTGAALQA